MNRKLYELQEIDNQIARIHRERARLDDGTAARSERDTLQAAVDVEKARLNTLNTQRMDKELQLKTSEEKLAKQQTRLMNATNAHEVTSLQRDIKGLTAARGNLDEEILTLMEEAESTTAKLGDLQGQLSAQTAETRRIEGEFAASAKRLDDELANAQQQRGALEGELSASEIAKYNTSAKQHHGVALAHIENGSCSVCGSAMTPFNLREAKTQEWPTCESCGRLLFVEE